MDLLVFGRVLWRFRILVGLGLLLAIVLAMLSIVRVGLRNGRPDLSYRKSEVWQASTTLLLTQQGFPWGGTAPTAEGEPTFGDPGRLTYLAVFYSKFANTDAVQSRVFSGRPLSGAMTAAPVTDEINDDPLPFITVYGTATSPRDAVVISRRGATVLAQYLAENQAAVRAAAKQRVKLTVVRAATGAAKVEGRKMTTPVFIFLAVLIATLGLAFVLENIRPRVRLVAAPPPIPLSSRDASAKEGRAEQAQ